MKKQCKNLFKIWILVLTMVFETAFAGYVPAYAAPITENTVVSDNTTEAKQVMPKVQEEVSNADKADGTEFTGIYNQKSNDLTWSITPEGHLTVSGQGNYGVSYGKYPAWDEYGEYVLTAEVNVNNITRTDFMFWQCPNLKSVDLSGLDTSKVTTMTHMFVGASSLESLNLGGLDTRNVEDMSYMFAGCSSLQSLIVKGTYFSTSKVKDMSLMFSGCSSLERIDVSGFDVREVEDMGHMFKSCKNLKTIDLSNFNASKVKDLTYMFYECDALESVNLIGFKTNSVTTLFGMFLGADSIKNIIFDTEFDTSNVTDMYGMFEGCSSLERIDFSHFNTSKVDNMTRMFYNCRALKTFDISHFDTSKVEGMGAMFYYCRALQSLDLSNFDTSSVVGMWDMFKGCDNLETLDISGFDTSNVRNMSGMFMYCYNLKSIIVNTETFTTENVTSFEEMFSNCKKLEYFDFSNFDTSNATKMLRMFTWCSSLKELDLSNFTTTCIDMTSPFTLGMDDLEKFTSGKEKRLYKLSTSALGWVDAKGKRYPDDVAIELEPNTTLYRLADTYNINYIYDGDAVDFQDTYKLDETLVLTGYVDKDHYTFDGWYTDAKYTKKITEITAGTYGDITLYAKMTPDTYSITYKNVEDILNAEQLTTSYAYGIEMTPVVPTKTCFLFDGWYLDEELTEVFTGISQATEGDLLLYAKWKENHDLDKENGVVIKEATTISEGEIEYKCKNCAYTELEKIPRVVTQESQITDETIINNPDEGDIKGSDFTKFQARADKTTKNSIRLKWNKIKEADGYKIYGNKCGKKNQYELITDLKGSKKTTWTQKKRKKGTYYKYIVRAYKVVDGQEITLAISKTIHATTTGGKSGNAKSVNIKTDKKCKKTKTGYTLTLKKGKTYKLKATEEAGAKKISIHRKIRFDSTNKEVATVSKGVVKAKTKGTCYIYAYAQNGVFKKIKVVVK